MRDFSRVTHARLYTFHFVARSRVLVGDRTRSCKKGPTCCSTLTDTVVCAPFWVIRMDTKREQVSFLRINRQRLFTEFSYCAGTLWYDNLQKIKKCVSKLESTNDEYGCWENETIWSKRTTELLEVTTERKEERSQNSSVSRFWEFLILCQWPICSRQCSPAGQMGHSSRMSVYA